MQERATDGGFIVDQVCLLLSALHRGDTEHGKSFFESVSLGLPLPKVSCCFSRMTMLKFLSNVRCYWGDGQMKGSEYHVDGLWSLVLTLNRWQIKNKIIIIIISKFKNIKTNNIQYIIEWWRWIACWIHTYIQPLSECLLLIHVRVSFKYDSTDHSCTDWWKLWGSAATLPFDLRGGW